jgi:D-beta-D-heptose 7-phosphate kinase/D-beta-D-heptose 1-phosphate adenosyltransferase
MDIQQRKYLNILLVGESCVDEYEIGSVTRISPEAPVPILKYEHTIRKLGMAANVKNNLEALDCVVDFVTNDREKIIKKRFVDVKSNQQLMRMDIENYLEPLTIDRIPLADYDAVIISDYCKGLVTDEVACHICINFKGKVFVDTKREDLSMFPYAFIKINSTEDLCARNLPRTATKIVTLGGDGAICEGVHYPAHKVNVHDVTGAGDVFLAALTYFGTQSNIYTGIEAANALAAKSVEHFGTYTITKKDLRETGYFLL